MGAEDPGAIRELDEQGKGVVFSRKKNYIRLIKILETAVITLRSIT